MAFLAENIDYAIAMADETLLQHQPPLRRDADPLVLELVTSQFVFRVAGGRQVIFPRSSWAGYARGSFSEHLAAYTELASVCTRPQATLVRFTIERIVRLRDEFRAQVLAGTRRPSSYVRPLNKSNSWGKVLLALSQAFGVPLTEEM